MKKGFVICAVLCAAVFPLTTQTARAVTSTSAPMRRLVYSFQRTVGQTSTVVSSQSIRGANTTGGRASQQYVSSGDSVPTTQSEAIESSGGGALLGVRAGAPVSDYRKESLSGSISVAIERQLPDHGLVVSVSERSSSGTVAPATCIVYGNTVVQCDSTKQVTPEEFSLLRYLGPNFVDPAQMDAQRHWQLEQKNGNVQSKADYTVAQDANALLTIDGTATITPASGSPTTIASTIGYDFSRSLPTTIKEVVAQTQSNGLAGSVSATATTVLQLVSDTKQ